MNVAYKTIVFLLTVSFPVFSQSITEGGSDLVGSAPFWRQALGGAVLSIPHLQAQSAVIAIDGGSIRAYSASGTPLWFFSAGGRISPFITRSIEGTSFLSRTNGTLIAINRAGREIWRRNIGNPLISKVVAGWDSRLFVPTDRKISCLTASGNLLWAKTFESPFSIAPKIDKNGGIIFALENSQVYRIDPFGNAKTYTLSGTAVEILSIERQQILALYKDRRMEILEAASDWFFSAQSEISSDIVVLPRLPAAPLAAAGRGNNIAAVLEDGRIALVSLNERTILWEGDTHIKEFSKSGKRPDTEVEMLFDERGIYILSKNGASGFNIEGKRLWYTLLENAAAIPAFGEDGVLYSGGNDWILYAYKIEDRQTQPGGVVFGPAPQGSYGMGIPQEAYMTRLSIEEGEIITKLEQIERAIKSGSIGSNEPAYTTFLLSLSARKEAVQYRVKALELLGQLGSRETVPWIMDIFRRETEPLLKAASASAAGNIGIDPDGIALRTFLYSLTHAPEIKDEQVLLTIISVVGALCRFSGPPLSENGIRILSLLMDRQYPAAVRRQAGIELSAFR